MVYQIYFAKVHYKNDRDPDGYKLTGDGNELQPEPDFFDTTFLNDQPGVVKWNERSPFRPDACFFEHAIQAHHPADNKNEKYNPSHTVVFIGNKSRD